MNPDKTSKCDVCATEHFERNNYFYGKQFTVRDLIQEQSYFNGKRHLVNRMVLGWGVVCGLDLMWDEKSRHFNVQTGMALDCCGREIIVCKPYSVAFDDYDNQCREAKGKQDYKCKFMLCLEYDECCVEPVDLPPVGGCNPEGRTEFNRIRDGYKVTIKKWEDACAESCYECPDHFKHKADPETSRNCVTPTIHQHLCEQLKECKHNCEKCNCVVLATFEVTSSGHGQYGQPQGYQQKEGQQQGYEQPPIKITLDACTNRRFVYNNSLLFDLINCHHGDLPHIVDFSWRRPAYPKSEVDFDTFVQMMRKGLKVYFDRKMVPGSLNPNTFIVSYIYRETGTGTYIAKRIPVEQIRSEQQGDCFTTTFVANPVWVDGELDRPDSELRADTRHEQGVTVEIVLRGSRIWSEDNKGLDGDFLANKLPTGNGTQGGDFVDWFRVMPYADKKKVDPFTDY
jgi:hypothetical protein